MQALQGRLEAEASFDAAHQEDVSQALAFHQAENWEGCLALLQRRPHRLNCEQLAVQASANIELRNFADAVGLELHRYVLCISMCAAWHLIA